MAQKVKHIPCSTIDSVPDTSPVPVPDSAHVVDPAFTPLPDTDSTPVPAADSTPVPVPDLAPVPDPTLVTDSVLVPSTVPDPVPASAPVPDPAPSKTVGAIKLIQNDIELLPKCLSQADVIMDKRRTTLLSRCGQTRSKSQSRKDVTDMRPIGEFFTTPGKRKASDSATLPKN